MSGQVGRPSLAPGDRIASYRIDGLVGKGGMGLVYRAWHDRLQRTVAIKVIAPELAAQSSFRARFERESLLAAQIEHPNVIPVYEVGESQGLLFIVMRYVEGIDVGELVGRSGRLEPRRAASIVNQAAAALDAAHARGLVHRDVKPGNLLVSGDIGAEHIYLTDFGITKRIADTTGLTATGQFIGTVDYVAPEQILGNPIDARSDVYALGCVLYQLLTGVVPFPRDSDFPKLYAHVNDPPPSPRELAPTVPGELDAVVTKATAKDPDDRYLSAGDLGRAAIAGAESRLYPGPPRSVAIGRAAPHKPEHEPAAAARQTEPAAPDDVDTAVTRASTTKPADRRVSASEPGAAAITAAKGTREADAPPSVTIGPADTHKPEQEPATAARDTVPAAPSEARAQRRAAGRSSRRVPRLLILALGVAVLAAAVTALVILGSPTSSPPPLTTGSHGQSGSPTSSGQLVWHPRPDLQFPMPIEGPGVTEYKGKLWVAGGCSAQKGPCRGRYWVDNVWYYDPRAPTPTTCEPSGQKPMGAWCPGPHLLQRIGHPALVSDGTRLYVLGGLGTDGKALSTVYRLDSPTSPTWQEDLPLGSTGTGQPSGGYPRAEGAAAWDGERIIYAGGIDQNGQVQADIWTFDRTRWTRLGKLQPAREQLAAATKGGTVWFIGGDPGGKPTKPLPDVDVITDVGQTHSALQRPVTGAAAVAFGARFCVVGGIRSLRGNPVSAVECQPGLSNTGLASPREGAGAAVVNGKVYVIGGWNLQHTGGQSTVEVLDIGRVQ